MTLPTPSLDDRRFQDLVDEAKRMVQRRCPEWTDHNVSDPGVTLIETFAFMVDQLLYRLNRVPDRLHVKLLELMGVTRFPAAAAAAEVTFWLSAAQAEAVTIPTGTVVATAATEFRDPVTFTVDEGLTIPSCSLARVAVMRERTSVVEDRTALLHAETGCRCFDDPPATGDSFLVGLTAPAPRAAVLLQIDCAIEGVGVDPLHPPLAWEAWTGRGWERCRVDLDETGGLNKPGNVRLHVPRGHVRKELAGHEAAWLRCRLDSPDPEQPTYHHSPLIKRLEAGTVGGTTTVVDAHMVEGEVLGMSEGVAGQRFALRHSPVVRTTEHELEVSTEPGEWEVWSEVETFAFSDADDRHFRLDETDGELVLGPAVREADGSLRHYGAVPPRGATLRIKSYRAGGGAQGNVAAGAISVLKTPIAFVSDEVHNRVAATGGRDVEDMESVKQRGPLVLRTRNRAVTASDYETLTREAAPGIARVKCVPANAAGAVRVLVVPSFGDDEGGRVDTRTLVPSEKVRNRITAYLDERRPVGVQVLVEPPTYQAVTIAARLRGRAGHDKERVRREALDALYRYCHPASGGPDGGGWPFGRSVRAGEIHGLLLGVHGVDVVDDVRLFRANPETGERGNPLQRIDLGPLTLAYSYAHSVWVEQS